MIDPDQRGTSTDSPTGVTGSGGTTGAGSTTTPGTQQSGFAAGSSGAAEQARREAGATTDEAKRRSGEMAEEAKRQGTQAAHEAKHRARSFFEDQKGRYADEVSGIAEAMRSASRQLQERDQPTPASYADRVADGADRFADLLRRNDLDDILHATEDFARRNPAAFLGGAVALGFMCARFLKASGERREGRYAGGYGETGYRTGGYGSETSGTSDYTPGATPYTSGAAPQGSSAGYAPAGAGGVGSGSSATTDSTTRAGGY